MDRNPWNVTRAVEIQARPHVGVDHPKSAAHRQES
jgi:hypothetical protein